MRWVFFFLFVANGGLLLWHWMEQGRIERIEAMNAAGAGLEVMPGERIVLFGEDASPADVGGIKHVATVGANRCFLLGPLDEVKVELGRYLDRAGVKYQLRDVKINQRTDYAVYLESPGARSDAERLLAALKQKGVDSFIIPGGELANGLSLGVFSDKNNASAQQKHVKQLGFDARIREAEKYDLEPWYVLSAVATEMSEEFWQKTGEAFPSIRKSEGFCQ